MTLASPSRDCPYSLVVWSIQHLFNLCSCPPQMLFSPNTCFFSFLSFILSTSVFLSTFSSLFISRRNTINGRTFGFIQEHEAEVGSVCRRLRFGDTRSISDVGLFSQVSGLHPLWKPVLDACNIVKRPMPSVDSLIDYISTRRVACSATSLCNVLALTPF